MRFYDENGLPIDLTLWQKLYRKPGYGYLAETEVEDLLVETAWVGVVSDHERYPCIFITQVIDLHTAATDKKQHVREPIWAPDKASAMRNHRGLVRELTKQPKKGGV